MKAHNYLITFLPNRSINEIATSDPTSKTIPMIIEEFVGLIFDPAFLNTVSA